MPERFAVEVTKDFLVFSAAHFITFGNNICERLHGHNYRVRCRVASPLEENGYVIDFILLRDLLQQLTTAWDHHVLLPLQHPTIKVRRDGNEVITTFESRRWVFPSDDCVLLPIANTTTELLARQLGHSLVAELRKARVVLPIFLEIGVDENFGQWGVWSTDDCEALPDV